MPCLRFEHCLISRRYGHPRPRQRVAPRRWQPRGRYHARSLLKPHKLKNDSPGMGGGGRVTRPGGLHRVVTLALQTLSNAKNKLITLSVGVTKEITVAKWNELQGVTPGTKMAAKRQRICRNANLIEDIDQTSPVVTDPVTVTLPTAIVSRDSHVTITSCHALDKCGLQPCKAKHSQIFPSLPAYWHFHGSFSMNRGPRPT